MSVSESPAEVTVVDSLGKACPVPVLDLAKAIGTVDVGAEILVLSDDPGSKVDIPVWCRMKSQTLVDVARDGRTWRFRVRRAV